MKILLKKVLVGLANSACDPLILTQTQLKVSFNYIQTHAKWDIKMVENMVNLAWLGLCDLCIKSTLTCLLEHFNII